MFIGKLEPIDLGEPIYGRTIAGCAPKEQLHLNCAYPSIDISPLRGFPTDSFSGVVGKKKLNT